MKALSLSLLISLSLAEPTVDRVISLKGWNNDQPFPFKMYSGYLPVLGSTKNLHYLYVDSQKDPANDPLIVWFNGGPGCSSMLGFAQEHGPYIMKDGGETFEKNPYSWNKEANMLYIEAPAGVGYSYCLNKEECVFDDNNQAIDNLNALLYFFNYKFPERKTNDLWLSGESYAGIYVPTLAYQIDQFNIKHATDSKIFKPKLKGFMVGNAVTNWKYDTFPAYIEMGYWHGLYDDDTYAEMHKNGCPHQFENFEFKKEGEISYECKNIANRFDILTKDINVYDVFGVCYHSDNTHSLQSEDPFETVEIGGEKRTYKKYATQADYTPWIKKFPHVEKRLAELPPCTFGRPIIKFFNQEYVRTELHIPTVAPTWDLCRDDYNYEELPLGSEWVYKQLRRKYRILVYSGDSDGSVPTLGSMNWIGNLGWTIKKEWQEYLLGRQVAGYFEELDGLTFMTIHGAGHMAPQFRPAETYHGIFSWLRKDAPFN